MDMQMKIVPGVEPLHFAIVNHAVTDVSTKTEAWLDHIAERRREAVVGFEQLLANIVLPDGGDFLEHARAQADIVIDRWCQERAHFARDFTSILLPDTVVVTQTLGRAAELGDLLGLHLDNALRDLDADLRAVIGSCWP